MANFIEIETSAELAELIAASHEKPVVLFKHSVTCPISTNVYDEVETLGADVNLVIVQNARGVSNEIAAETGVRHETPQAIVLKNGKAVYHASHYDISAADLEGALGMKS